MSDSLVKIFDDLDRYRDFCREYGRVFDEAHLYKRKTPFDDFRRWEETGKARAWPGYRPDIPFNTQEKRPYVAKDKRHNKPFTNRPKFNKS